MNVSQIKTLYQKDSNLYRSGALTFVVNSQDDMEVLQGILINPNPNLPILEPSWQIANVLLNVQAGQDVPINNIMTICQMLIQSSGAGVNRFPGFNYEQLAKFNDQNWMSLVNSYTAGSYEIVCEYVRTAFVYTIFFRSAQTQLVKAVMRITIAQNSPYVGP
jgi:hypothetical protein